MTRINLLHPSHLTKRHLIAEWKEITQILHLVKKRVDENHPMNDLPPKYTLNGGHIKFFMNKGKYIHDRFLSLADELIARQVNIDYNNFLSRLNRIRGAYSPALFNDYQPDKEAYQILIDRIASRILQKPHLYPDSNRFFDSIPIYLGDTYALNIT